MRGQHLRRALGSDHRANTDFPIDAEVSAKDGDVEFRLRRCIRRVSLAGIAAVKGC